MEKEKVSFERMMAMQAGNAELQSRLLDLIRSGLVELDMTPQYFEEFATRMVDAQLGSLGKRIRGWANLRENNPDRWYEQLLSEMGTLYLFSKAFQNFDKLPERLQDELLSQVGVTTRTSDLFQQPSIEDEWLVLGHIKTPEPNNLTSRRTWFLGKNCKKIVLLLEYAFGTTEFTTLWFDNQVYSAQAVYYPAAYPLRVAFKSVDLAPSFSDFRGFSSFSIFLQTYSEALAQNPWLSQFPVILTGVIPVFAHNGSYLIDVDNNVIQTEGRGLSIWSLLAQSGGRPMTVFGEWNGQSLVVLNAYKNNDLSV
ncbi:MAG: hypothetical protein JNL70_03295 [Saprospiraceae bacterium]|nr:hypothetical protein [Saprospiraceae bacterium]